MTNTNTTTQNKKQIGVKWTITQRVIPFGNGWVVKSDHVNKFFAVTSIKAQAIKIATQLAKSGHAKLIVHNKNGTVQMEKNFRKTIA